MLKSAIFPARRFQGYYHGHFRGRLGISNCNYSGPRAARGSLTPKWSTQSNCKIPRPTGSAHFAFISQILHTVSPDPYYPLSGDCGHRPIHARIRLSSCSSFLQPARRFAWKLPRLDSLEIISFDLMDELIGCSCSRRPSNAPFSVRSRYDRTFPVVRYVWTGGCCWRHYGVGNINPKLVPIRKTTRF
jgi:hypothetical protein